jgi:UDP-2-acetamido-2,6-beta-L-arabino-hexul-4-ose reductase
LSKKILSQSCPHITKGNHWHHTKNEKFLVVSRNGVIRFRKIDSNEIIEYYVSMVTIMWVNKIFDKECPDTFF